MGHHKIPKQAQDRKARENSQTSKPYPCGPQLSRGGWQEPPGHPVNSALDKWPFHTCWNLKFPATITKAPNSYRQYIAPKSEEPSIKLIHNTFFILGQPHVTRITSKQIYPEMQKYHQMQRTMGNLRKTTTIEKKNIPRLPNT